MWRVRADDWEAATMRQYELQATLRMRRRHALVREKEDEEVGGRMKKEKEGGGGMRN